VNEDKAKIEEVNEVYIDQGDEDDTASTQAPLKSYEEMYALYMSEVSQTLKSFDMTPYEKEELSSEINRDDLKKYLWYQGIDIAFPDSIVDRDIMIQGVFKSVALRSGISDNSVQTVKDILTVLDNFQESVSKSARYIEDNDITSYAVYQLSDEFSDFYQLAKELPSPSFNSFEFDCMEFLNLAIFYGVSSSRVDFGGLDGNYYIRYIVDDIRSQYGSASHYYQYKAVEEYFPYTLKGNAASFELVWDSVNIEDYLSEEGVEVVRSYHKTISDPLGLLLGDQVIDGIPYKVSVSDVSEAKKILTFESEANELKFILDYNYDEKIPVIEGESDVNEFFHTTYPVIGDLCQGITLRHRLKNLSHPITEVIFDGKLTLIEDIPNGESLTWNSFSVTGSSLYDHLGIDTSQAEGYLFEEYGPMIFGKGKAYQEFYYVEQGGQAMKVLVTIRPKIVFEEGVLRVTSGFIVDEVYAYPFLAE